MKRILAFMLAFVMLLGMIPVAYATEAEELPVEIPVAEEPTPEETEPVAEETEPAAEETEPIPETEPVETEPVTEETEPVTEATELATEPDVQAMGVLHSGTCGDNVTWVLESNGTLTLSGTGATKDYIESDDTHHPWDGFADNIKKVVIEDGITRIGNYLFYGEYGYLRELEIANTVTEIGSHAFEMVPITGLQLPDSVVTLGDFAFADTYLETVTFGKDLQSIGDGAFSGAPVSRYTVPGGNACFTTENGAVYTADKGELVVYPCDSTATSFTVNEATTAIRNYAFGVSGNLTQVVLPAGLKTIGKNAFASCTKLTQLNLPEGLTEMGEGALYNAGLTGITFPTSLKELPVRVCYSCDNLQKVVLPEGLQVIGVAAFQNCVALETVNLPESLTDIGSNAFWGAGLKEVVVPSGITELKKTVFYRCESLESVTLPEGLVSIATSALGNTTSLKTITLPSTLKTIDGCFGFSGLTEITIPAGVETIDGMAFSNCTNLESVTFLGSAPSFSSFAFLGTTTTVYYPMNNVTWDAVKDQNYGGTLTWVAVEKVCAHENLTEVPAKESTCTEQGYPTHLICTCGQRFLEDGVTKIALEDILLPLTEHDYRNGSCTGCGGALPFNYYADTSTGTVMLHNYTGTETDVIVPAYVDGYPVTRLESTFCGCSQLKSVVLPDTLIIVGASAFSDCENLTALVIPEGVTEISWSAFQNCKKLESVALPSTLVSLGDFTFTDCCGLKRVEIPAGIQKIADGTFSGCTGLTQVTIPERVTQIGTMAFSGCSKLESVVLPDSITAIGSAAFQYCTALKEISLPAELTEITSMLFVGCASLPSVQLPAGVTAIANSAFSDCSGLEYISIPKTTTFIGTRAFYNCSALKCVSFAGTEEEAKDISVGTGNEPLTDAVWHYEGGCCTPQINVTLDADTQKPLISWELRPCLGQYAIFRGEDPDNMEEQIGVTSEGSWLDETAPHNGCYYMVFGTTRDETGGAASDPRNLDGKLVAPKLTGESVPYSGKPVISWNSVYGAVKYEVYRATSATGKYSKVKTTTETSYLDSSASAAKTYYYKVKAIAKSSSKNGPLSEYISVPCLCAQPEITIKLNTATGTPELSWKKVSGAANYLVYRASEDSEGYYEEFPMQTGTTFKDVTAPADQECSYVVIAYAKNNTYGSVIPGFDDRPAIHTGIGQPVVTTASDAATGLPVISWNAVNGAAEYEISRSAKSNGTYEVIGTTDQLNFVDETASAGKSNYYKVTAISAKGTRSAASAYKSAKRVCTAPVITITNDAPTGKPQVIWEAVEGAKKYEVYRATSETGKYSKVTTTSALSYTDSKASLGKFYYYKVKAVASSSTYNSGFSDTVARLTICAQPKLTVSLDTATGKPVISWSKVTGAKRYVLLRAMGDSDFETCVISLSAAKFVNEDAVADTTYRYKILAQGEAYELDSLDVAEPVSVTVSCGQPVITTASDAVTGLPVISWNAVEGAANYEVSRATKSSGTYTPVATTADLRLTDDTVTGGKTYYYKVTAITAGGNRSVASSYKSAKCICATPELSVLLDVTSGKPSLSWNAVSGAKKYEVYRATSENGKYAKVTTTTKLTYQDSKASVGKTYYYKIKAVASSSSYNSAYSQILSCESFCACPQVTVSVDTKTWKPTLSWKKVTGAAKYRIFRSDREDGEFTLLKEQTSLSYKITDAETDVVSYYRVIAVASNPAYNSLDVTPVAAAATYPAPVISGAVTDQLTGKPVIAWKAVEGAAGYQILRATSSKGTYAPVGTTTGLEFMDESAPVGKTCYYKVCTMGQYTISPASAYKSAKCKCAAPVIALSLNENVKPVISWEAVEGAKKYEVYRATSENGKYSKVTTTSALTYTDSKAASGKTYYYKVKAVASSSSYSSAYSNIAGITVAPPA